MRRTPPAPRRSVSAHAAHLPRLPLRCVRLGILAIALAVMMALPAAAQTLDGAIGAAFARTSDQLSPAAPCRCRHDARLQGHRSRSRGFANEAAAEAFRGLATVDLAVRRLVERARRGLAASCRSRRHGLFARRSEAQRGGFLPVAQHVAGRSAGLRSLRFAAILCCWAGIIGSCAICQRERLAAAPFDVEIYPGAGTRQSSARKAIRSTQRGNVRLRDGARR